MEETLQRGDAAGESAVESRSLPAEKAINRDVDSPFSFTT
jgi:hypothetical protein